MDKGEGDVKKSGLSSPEEHSGNQTPTPVESVRKDSIPEANEDGDESDDSAVAEIRAMEEKDNVFQQLLGLPEISIETLYMQYKEKDKTIIKLMNEHTNFIQVHEGYPEFINF